MSNKLTVYVNNNKKELAKKKGYNLSKVMNGALDILLDIDDDDEIKLKNKINETDKNIKELIFKRKLLISELKNSKKDRLKDKDSFEKKKAYNLIVKEMRETKDINIQHLEETAKKLGVKSEELFNKAKIDAGWIKKNYS